MSDAKTLAEQVRPATYEELLIQRNQLLDTLSTMWFVVRDTYGCICIPGLPNYPSNIIPWNSFLHTKLYESQKLWQAVLDSSLPKEKE